MNLCFTLGEVIVCDSLIHSLWQVEIWFPTVASSLGKPRVATHPHGSGSSILRVYGSLLYVGESKGEFVLKLFLFARGQYIDIYEYIINNRILYCIFISQNVSEKEWNNEGKDKSGVHSPSAAFGWIQGIISSSTKSPDQRDNGARVLQSHQLAIIITRHPIHLSRTQSHRIAKGDKHMACLRKASTSLGGGVIYCNPGDLKHFGNREIYQTYLWLHDDFWVHASVLSSNIQQDPSTQGSFWASWQTLEAAQ